MKRKLILAAIAAATLLVVGAGGNYGASLYYAAGHGNACGQCHEMTASVSGVHGSSHHDATCTDCHEAGIAGKLRHVRDHIAGRVPEQIHLAEADVRAMGPRCQRCHQHEYASWHAGPHAATYSQLFLDTKHNTSRRLNDDCLRCHGMYFDGAMRDLVQPQNTAGPWHLTRAELSEEPAIPCQACHWIHNNGPSQTRPSAAAPSLAVSSVAAPPATVSSATPALRDTVAFYDRREQLHFAAASLALPQLYDGPRPVALSRDPRQGLCYQCHAPRQPEALSPAALNHWGPQAGSGDDRTPIGVHAGLSCLACHAGHGESARASCVGCHPALSNCGLDVEKMDTSFVAKTSRHNIHSVKCADCHQNGVPTRKRSERSARQSLSQYGQ